MVTSSSTFVLVQQLSVKCCNERKRVLGSSFKTHFKIYQERLKIKINYDRQAVLQKVLI